MSEKPPPMCTCDLEKVFSAQEAFGLEPEREPYEVVDAERVLIARCSEQRFAHLVAWALNNAPACVRRHEGELSPDDGTACPVHHR